jgi:hypothetical protein
VFLELEREFVGVYTSFTRWNVDAIQKVWLIDKNVVRILSVFSSRSSELSETLLLTVMHNEQ